jgi:hypothetical protein
MINNIAATAKDIIPRQRPANPYRPFLFEAL